MQMIIAQGRIFMCFELGGTFLCYHVIYHHILHFNMHPYVRLLSGFVLRQLDRLCKRRICKTLSNDHIKEYHDFM